LLAINGVSLGIAILANLALLLSTAHRLPFRVAQPITIIGWYISSLLLLSLIAVTPTHLNPNAIYTYAQPFIYACLSASLYFILATILVITTYFASKGYYSPDISSMLTLPQRTLMGQSSLFIVYLICGAAVFARIEGWMFVDGVYWGTITLLTIGYGDIVPVTHLGRSLIIPYAIAGIVMLGLVVGSIGSLVLDRAATKMGARLTVMERRKLETELQNIQQEQGEGGVMSKERREFNLMRRIQARARSKQRWSLLLISTVALLLLWFIGAAVFYSTESATNSFESSSWTYFDGVYFIFITLLTIGYGDFSPHSNAGRPLFVFWGLLAVPTMTILIASMGATVLVVIKAIIAKIDKFVVLPHEHGGDQRKKDSFSRKALHMGKLKAKARVGVNGKGHEAGHEIHDGGVRNPDTGEVMDVEKHTQNVPHIDNDTHDANRERAFLIAKEIRGLLQDVGSGDKRYSFEEWARFLKLLGYRHVLDEGDDEANEGKGKARQWSWLRDDGPLFGKKSETEWILERLSRQLEDALRGR
jgi:potassium channel subfamily K